MILPNVLNRPSLTMPSLFYDEGSTLALSTVDYFQSWEALPERGALAFPKLLGVRGEKFCQARLDAGNASQQAAFALRSTWALIASADRRWREKADGGSVPGAPGVMLRYFEPSQTAMPGQWAFDDGLAVPRHLGRVEMDDRYGRVLEVEQNDLHSELRISAGWQIGCYEAFVRQETYLNKRGDMRVGYRFEFGEEYFDALRMAVGLDESQSLDRLVMRLAALIVNSGQYAADALGPFCYEQKEYAVGRKSLEQVTRVGFLGQENTYVELRDVSRVNAGRDELQKRRLYSRRLNIHLASAAHSKRFALQPLLLEKLWNPVYARALTNVVGVPWEA